MRDSMPSTSTAAGEALDQLGPEPPASRPRDRTAWQLRVAARACRTMGSPLYGHLLDHAADDCAAAGPTWRVLAGHAADGRGDALALRLMAAVHRLVLERRAPRLATFYPSVGGTGALDGAWAAFRAALVTDPSGVSELVARPCQTNEVGRAAALAIGFAEVAKATGLPLRLLEVGASAGLNLRCDHYRIGGGGVAMGDEDSPVDLSSHWRTPPPAPPARLDVADRRGCDLHPVDPTTNEGRLILTASVWADQAARHARLRGALEVARRVPAVVDRASLDAWVGAQLRELPAGVATVVYHSVVAEYLDGRTRDRFVEAVTAAGERADRSRPLAWVRLEPISQLRQHGVALTLWPGGDTATLARCGAHGDDTVWQGDDNGPRPG
ncbi:MAG: DUF2332 domain-containing protein [Actinobacteria bacterium]|nr:DUF2332 domain-containing protein [Actinomycetota bacterium]